ncbi:ABC transporter substrate-binding protein [Tardiphaga sp. 866_E4_N2_1]|uniref:ABC transporter substrate-binding protein n=1 Tax=unclassified Tardiphaga TaxID=2631404 RepID=UPI003F20A6A6
MVWSLNSSFFAVCAAALAFAGPAQAAEPVKIGVISPVTGPVALDGESFRNGAALAVRQINAASEAGSARLELLIEDGECKPSVSVSAAQKLLVRDKVPVLLGAHCSAATAAVLPIAERQKVPFVTGISSAPSLTQTRHEFFFRLPPTEEMTAKAAVPFYLKRLGLRSIAFLALNDEWGRQAAEVNGSLLESNGVKVVSTDYFLPGESEFGAALTTIKAKAPDAIFVAANAREGILIAKKVEELGLTQKRLGVGAWPTNTFIERAGQSGMGWTVISQYVPDIATDRNRTFVEAYEQVYHVPPDKYAVSGFDAVTVIADAIRRAGRADPSAIRQALEKSDVQVVQGRVSFDDKHQAYTNAVLSENKDKRSIVLSIVPTSP